jgi:hypothetical protein
MVTFYNPGITSPMVYAPIITDGPVGACASIAPASDTVANSLTISIATDQSCNGCTAQGNVNFLCVQ